MAPPVAAAAEPATATCVAATQSEPASGGYKLPALRVLSEITAGLATESDVEPLLERFLGTMMRLAGASAGAVWLLSSDEGYLRLVGAHGLPPDLMAHERVVKFPCGICGAAILGDDIAEEDDVSSCAARTGSSFFGSTCHRIVAVPLRHRGSMLGVYSLYLPRGHEVPQDVAMLFRSIGEHLGLALENARLTRENMRMSLMAERQMLASEIHDSLAQTLAYMKMRVSIMREALDRRDLTTMERYTGDFEDALGDAYRTLRELISNFRNRMDPRGLLPALTELATTFRTKTGITLEFVNEAPGMHLSVEQEVQVFHIVQEALNNVVKHSSAGRAWLRLRRTNGWYEASVGDDGTGLRDSDPERPVLRPDHIASFGISIMRERAARLGGEILIHALPGKGTEVRLRFPCAEEESP